MDSTELQEKYFPLLDALDCQKITNQRQLSEQTGMSLGMVNFILKRLLKKGLVKVDNFQKSPNKRGYIYLLTPEGIEAKSKLAVNFILTKLREYNSLRSRLTDRLAPLVAAGNRRIVFIGPPVVKEFLESVINEKDLELVQAAHCNSWQEMMDIEPDRFDIALLFDSSADKLETIGRKTGIPTEKLISLW